MLSKDWMWSSFSMIASGFTPVHTSGFTPVHTSGYSLTKSLSSYGYLADCFSRGEHDGSFVSLRACRMSHESADLNNQQCSQFSFWFLYWPYQGTVFCFLGTVCLISRLWPTHFPGRPQFPLCGAKVICLCGLHIAGAFVAWATWLRQSPLAFI